MEKKILLSDLTDLLAQRAGITKKRAESFLRTFFEVTAEGLHEEHYVKIKGFGTFKLVTVASRESVDVSTGSRIQIDSHSKVSFTVDAKLRDLVNRPFAHFSNVVLNEGAEIEKVDEEMVEEPVETPVAEPVAVVEPEPVPEPDPAPDPVPSPAPVEEPVKEPEPVEVPAPETVPEPEPEPLPAPEPEPEPQVKKSRGKIVVFVIVLVLCALGVYFAVSRNQTASEPVKADTVAVKDTVVQPQVKMPEGDYEIVGFKTDHKVKHGETLRIISRLYYDRSIMVDYILYYNNIPSADSVKDGMMLKIPELKHKKR